MSANYYMVDTEDGGHIDDPSEDALFDLIDGLSGPDNTFMTITPADDSDWHATVSLLDDGGYEVEQRDPGQHEHDLTTDTDIGRIANALTRWLAARF